MSGVQRLAGAALAATGAILLAADSPRWDVVLVTIAPGHGLDLSDVVGVCGVIIGVALVWTAPPHR